MDWVKSFDNFYYYLFSKYYKNKKKILFFQLMHEMELGTLVF